MSENISGLDRQIKAMVEPIYLTLGKLASQDQRVGAKSLYRDNRFTEIVRSYLIALLDIMNGKPTTVELRSHLASAITDFIDYNEALFPTALAKF